MLFLGLLSFTMGLGMDEKSRLRCRLVCLNGRRDNFFIVIDGDVGKELKEVEVVVFVIV